MSRHSELPKTKTNEINDVETDDLIRNTYQVPVKGKIDPASIRLCN